MTPGELRSWLDDAEWRMPLANLRPWNAQILEGAAALGAASVFPGARSPEGAFAGLMLYLGDWNRAHRLAQDLHTAEGAYWHGIIHRQEPDAWNSNYWFRQAGRHPIFAALVESTAAAAERRPEARFPELREWSPAAFIDYCEAARRSPGSAAEALAVEIQHIEWKMLFEYCQGA